MFGIQHLPSAVLAIIGEFIPEENSILPILHPYIAKKYSQIHWKTFILPNTVEDLLIADCGLRIY